jgi:hypothetical protein
MIHGRSAVFDFTFDNVDTGSSRILDYDRAALLQPCWAETTLCGREWANMIGGEAGPVQRYGETAFAPTCQRCLALMDKLFPAPTEDPRLPLVAADVIAEHGFCEVHHVPGDQQLALPKAIRAKVKAKTGHRIETTLIDATLYIHCEAIYALHADQYSRAAGEAVSAFLASQCGPLPHRCRPAAGNIRRSIEAPRNFCAPTPLGVAPANH